MPKIKHITLQEKKAKITKDKILKAALKLMKTHEYKYLTVRNICDMAGVTTGAFYYHFKSKEHLISHFVHEGYMQFTKENQSILDNMNELDKILYTFEWFPRYCFEQGFDFVSNFFIASNQVLNVRNPISKTIPFFTQVADDISLYIEDAQKKGVISKEIVPLELYHDLNILLYGTIFDWCLCSGSYDLIKKVREILINYLNNFLELK